MWAEEVRKELVTSLEARVMNEELYISVSIYDVGGERDQWLVELDQTKRRMH